MTPAERKAQTRFYDLAFGRKRQSIDQLAPTFDPPQLGASEIDAGLAGQDPTPIRTGCCRSGRFPELVAEWAQVENQWLWGVTLSGKPLESGWRGNRTLARKAAIDALGRASAQLAAEPDA